MEHSGYVYIVHGVGTQYIKVGTTINLRESLRDVARGVPFRICVLSVELVFDMDTREKELLAHYAPYRCRGQWFALPEDRLQEWPLEADVAPFASVKEFPRPAGNVHPKARARRRAAAKEWLRDFLGAQEIASIDIAAAATAVGISGKGLIRAKESLCIRPRKRGYRWYWALPDNAPQIATENT